MYQCAPCPVFRRSMSRPPTMTSWHSPTTWWPRSWLANCTPHPDPPRVTQWPKGPSGHSSRPPSSSGEAVRAAGGSSRTRASPRGGRPRARLRGVAADAHALCARHRLLPARARLGVRIISPSTAALDRARKVTSYAREQVGHAWLIDPVARTLEVLRLEAGRWVMSRPTRETSRYAPSLSRRSRLRWRTSGSTDFGAGEPEAEGSSGDG